MARIRTIKPEFFTSEQVADCSPTARLLFIGMWCFCDDGGVHPASIKRLKMEIFPADTISETEIDLLVDDLIKAELLTEFIGDDGKNYWQVTGWHHQKIEKPTLRHPQKSDHSPTIRRLLADHSPTEGSLRESKGKESKGKEVSVSVPKSFLDRTDDFDEFWSRWVPYEMTKGSKQDAAKAYAKARKEIDHDTLIRTSAQYFSNCQAVRSKTKHVASWLNGRGWESDDAISQIAARNGHDGHGAGGSNRMPTALELALADRTHRGGTDILEGIAAGSNNAD